MVNSSDLVYNKTVDGEFQSGGYKITPYMFGEGAMVSSGGVEENSQTGGSVAALSGLKELAVPAGLMYLQQTVGQNNRTQGTVSKKLHEEVEVLSNDIYDDLLMLVSPEQRRLLDNKTRKRRGKKNQKTRKINKK